MSAIAAVVGPQLREADCAWLKEATALQARGAPHGTATHVEGAGGLGHALLRISDRDVLGPTTLDRRTWIVADARLDDRASLIRALAGNGCRVDDATHDAELLLHAHRTWGEACVDHLLGDFAFVVWDADRCRLLAACDQLGVTPLHLAPAGSHLLVASGVDALLLHPDVAADLDDEGVAAFLLDDSPVTFEHTVRTAVRRLPPGRLLTWEGGHRATRRYWRHRNDGPLLRLAPEEVVERFRGLIDQAVAERVPGLRVSAHLSGGLDSTSIAVSAASALAQAGAAPGALRLLTLGLGPGSGDEEPKYAQEVARALGAPLEVSLLSEHQLTDPFAAPATPLPEPVTFRRTTAQLEMTRTAARHGGVALTGLGGDVVLASPLWSWARWALRGRPVRAVQALTERPRLGMGRPRPHLRAALAGWRRRRRIAESDSVPDWLAAGLLSDDLLVQRRRVRQRVVGADPTEMALHPSWSALAREGDPTSTGLPLKHAHPFYDLRLLAFASRLAPDPWLEDKRVLREAMRGRLPEVVRGRRKTALVRTVQPGDTDAMNQRLAELVRQAPGLDRFVDRSALAELVGATGLSAEPALLRPVERALGLAHWLTHRSGV